MRNFFLSAAVIAAVGWAQEAKPPETTPTELAGSEARVVGGSGAETRRVFIFKPEGWRASDRRGALVWFFGGGWTTGTPANAAAWARWAAAQGLVGIAPDYRTNGRFGTSPREAVADGRAALRWVQEHAAEWGVDAARIAVGGNSAGGHVALWTALAHSPPGSRAEAAPLAPPRALVLTSAVSDTSPETGYTPGRFGADARAFSPVHQLDARMPAALIFHGDADVTVPQRQSLALGEALRATGNAVEFVSVPGGTHAFARELPEWWERVRARTGKFLRERGVSAGEKAGEELNGR